MSSLRLTDVQIATGLQAHLPGGAQTGLHARIRTAVESTPQRRPRLWALGVLADADPQAWRRILLIVALLLVSLAVAGALAAGALRQWQRTAVERSVEEIVAQTLATYEDPPAMWMSTPSGRYLYDGAGRMRTEWAFDQPFGRPGAVALMGDGYLYESLDGGATWRDLSGRPHVTAAQLFDIGFSAYADCPHWVDLGEDVLRGGAPVRHLACGADDFWIHRVWHLVVRTNIRQILDLQVTCCPADVFRLPNDAIVRP
jgi:hypothetical protein